MRWQFVKESETLPALAMGLNDFIGTGRYSGEYIVATKNIGPVKITGGLGFGRLATHGAVSNPLTSLHNGFETRADRDVGKGGTTHYAQWFRGDVAPFGGLEWQVNPKLRVLAEYSSDDYGLEQSYFDQKSPVNVGIKYQARPDVGFGLYYLHGTTVAVSAHITADPGQSANGSGRELAPLPVRVRGGSGGQIVVQTNYDAMIQALGAEGMIVRGIDVKNTRAVIQVENKRYRSHAQAAGRTVRIASFLLADVVETIVVEFVDKDLVISSLEYDRSEFERLETQVSAGPDLMRSITFSDAQDLTNWQAPEERFQWGLGPYLEYSLFDPLEPIKGIVGAKFAAQYTLGPGFKISGEVRKPVLSSFKSGLRASDSVLPHVRSDAPIYKQQGDPALHSLTLSKLTKLSPTIYARATAGYLEPMFAGVSGDVRVLHDINLAIKDKEFIVFVGPSGCGKSTLLRIIAGLEEATSGAILIGGDDVSTAQPIDRGISMVFQSYALYPHLTVFENIAFPLRVQKMGKDELTERVNRAASILKLTEKLQLKPGQLSGGQRQRVAIGRSIVRNPKVFLFDEPLSNLDAALRGDMRVELSQLHQELDATMVYVTHDQVEAMTMADRIVVLNGGYVEQFGTPMELYHHPATKFVAQFIGQPNMNLIPANVAGISESGLAVRFPAGYEMTLPVDTSGASEGDQVEVGIRPENVALTDGAGLVVSVDVLERLGGVSITYGRTAGSDQKFCASLPGDAEIIEGRDITLSINAADCHVFGADGRVLRRLDAPKV